MGNIGSLLLFEAKLKLFLKSVFYSLMFNRNKLDCFKNMYRFVTNIRRV